MNNIDFVYKLQNTDLIIKIIKFFFISIFSYYMYMKITNYRNIKKPFINFMKVIMIMFVFSILVAILQFKLSTFDALLAIIIGLSSIFKVFFKNKVGYTILNTIISATISYILFFVSLIICFIINITLKIENDYISLFFILIIYTILLIFFLRIKKIKNGIVFLVDHSKNDYFDMLVLNLSVIILFLLIMLTNIDIILKRSAFTGILFISIIIFVTIHEFLQLYYKEKLLIQDLEETKRELEQKRQETYELEKEILNNHKDSHSIAHKQRLLEYKINELIINSEISNELQIIDEVKKLGIEISKKEINIELSKTGIEELDDILDYMKAECLKNEIQFELQVKGNIHQMVNNYISKEKLQILIADHIKNSIIAIQHSNNEYKNILVRIGEINGQFSLYIYDTGIEFQQRTLEKLGKVPSTTYEEEGGSGMGFMNTFDTLKECKASLIIKEIGKQSKDNYTKVIMIKFDNKNEFKIISYEK